jgi:hypothetical protein
MTIGNCPIDIDTFCLTVIQFGFIQHLRHHGFVSIPTEVGEEKYIVLHFLLPEDTLELRCRTRPFLYDVWNASS